MQGFYLFKANSKKKNYFNLKIQLFNNFKTAKLE